MKQYEYVKKIADYNYTKFFELGHAIAGNNGPHGHRDTPVRNTSHYLIIYTYLYKVTNNSKYLDIVHKFANYLIGEQKKSVSGAIQCMISDSFDHLNGLIGQGWVIEALLYYYEHFKIQNALDSAKEIFLSQNFDYSKHLWTRIELDGRNIGIDITFNHQVWFAACSTKLMDYCTEMEISKQISDFVINGLDRYFRIYPNGLLHHVVDIINKDTITIFIKSIIKDLAFPIKKFSPRKLDKKYIERAYHIFDMYGIQILRERFVDLPFFTSKKYLSALKYALDIDEFNSSNGINLHDIKSSKINVFSYYYNSPAFEYPYIAITNGQDNLETFSSLYNLQEKLSFDPKTLTYSINKPDYETWNARTYEIIRYLEKTEQFPTNPNR